MKRALAILLVIGLVIGAFTACVVDPGGSNGSRVVSGTITVPNDTYWSAVKIGIFSGGSAGTYGSGTFSYLDTKDNGGGIGAYRVYYSNNDDGSAVMVSPEGGTSYTISGSGATERSYTFELPSTPPVEDENFYYAAWYDGNLDGILDLVGHWDFFIPNGEYNRCATKGSTLTVEYFAQSVDLELNVNGNYK